YVEEVRRIAAECRERHEARQKEKSAANPALVQLGVAINGPNPASGGREPPVDTQTGADPLVRVPPAPLAEGIPFSSDQLLKPPERRWYPVIDYSRCTNCMECLDFCLFGVYGVDALDRLVVENQDNCKRGCPACSRVCPEHAIMFPDYKTPA